MISSIFRGVICQSVHSESKISHFRPFSKFNSPPWFFTITRRLLRKCKFKIIFSPSLGSLGISRPNLINLYLRDFGACFSNQCTQNQTKDIRAVFLFFTDLLGFFLKLAFELESVTAKQFLLLH